MTGTKLYTPEQANYVFARNREGHNNEQIAELFKEQWPRWRHRGRQTEFTKFQAKYILGSAEYQRNWKEFSERQQISPKESSRANLALNNFSTGHLNQHAPIASMNHSNGPQQYGNNTFANENELKAALERYNNDSHMPQNSTVGFTGHDVSNIPQSNFDVMKDREETEREWQALNQQMQSSQNQVQYQGDLQAQSPAPSGRIAGPQRTRRPSNVPGAGLPYPRRIPMPQSPRDYSHMLSPPMSQSSSRSGHHLVGRELTMEMQQQLISPPMAQNSFNPQMLVGKELTIEMQRQLYEAAQRAQGFPRQIMQVTSPGGNRQQQQVARQTSQVTSFDGNRQQQQVFQARNMQQQAMQIRTPGEIQPQQYCHQAQSIASPPTQVTSPSKEHQQQQLYNETGALLSPETQSAATAKDNQEKQYSAATPNNQIQSTQVITPPADDHQHFQQPAPTTQDQTQRSHLASPPSDHQSTPLPESTTTHTDLFSDTHINAEFHQHTGYDGETFRFEDFVDFNAFVDPKLELATVETQVGEHTGGGEETGNGNETASMGFDGFFDEDEFEAFVCGQRGQGGDV
ncbi:hypothetical protein GLAREA_08521 [Glarea lozoyensis ATCC 20868]|uniref:Uncharacterized protein n=1 Tax=Glarea lozoyensis (strain ATCC 20868 / MF5171) TaxID=1116229 RepID=S3DDC1_GLAL2|nr:uncharacterized protein GLAREA_08521 [Glarea lozoyensis ATCC 20868]EPE24668.1 hypothetical protein GLAREA_08521 [Glarea lozoyensis ATCC 20868]